MNKKILTNTLSQIWAKVWTALIAIFVVKILTNYLWVDWFGLYSKIYSYVTIFAVIADLWLYTITVRELSQNKNNPAKSEAIMWNMMSFRVFVWIIWIVLSLIIAYFLPWYNEWYILFAIFIAWIFNVFWLINSSVLALLQANLKTEFSIVSTIVWKIINIILISILVFLIILKQDLWLSLNGNVSNYELAFILIFTAWLLWNIISSLLLWIYAKRHFKFWFKFNKNILKNLIKLSLPFWLALFLNVIFFKSDVIVLSFIEWKQADTSIWIYSVAIKVLEVWMLFGAFFLNSLLTLFTSFIKNKDKSGLHKSVINAFYILFTWWLFLSIFTFFNAEYLTLLISWHEYLDKTKYLYTSADAFKVVSSVFFFYFLSSLFTYILIANNEQSKMLKINWIIASLNIIWNILIIPHYSFIWAWIITVITQILLLISTYIASRNIIKIRLNYKYISVIMLLNILISLSYFYNINYLNNLETLNNYSINIFLKLWLNSLIWISILWIFWVIFKKEIKSNFTKLKDLN